MSNPGKSLGHCICYVIDHGRTRRACRRRDCRIASASARGGERTTKGQTRNTRSRLLKVLDFGSMPSWHSGHFKSIQAPGTKKGTDLVPGDKVQVTLAKGMKFSPVINVRHPCASIDGPLRGTTGEQRTETEVDWKPTWCGKLCALMLNTAFFCRQYHAPKDSG